MKKSIFLAIIATTVITGCATTKTSVTKSPNPASEFCVSVHGKSIIKKDANGNEYGVCQLPNGQKIEEWEFYRGSAKIIIEGDTIKK